MFQMKDCCATIKFTKLSGLVIVNKLNCKGLFSIFINII